MKKEVLRLQDVTYKKENTFIFRNMTFSIRRVRLWDHTHELLWNG